VKRVPRWVLIVLILLAFVIAAGLVAPFFLDADRYRATIAGALKDATGRETKIGKISARLLPSVAVVVEDFSIANPPGFAPGNVVSVEQVTCGLELIPLFSKQFKLTYVDIESPKLSLLEDAAGRTNYDFSKPKSRGKGKPATDARGFEVADIPAITLSNAEVMVGRVSGRSGKVEKIVRATGLNVQLDTVALDVKRLKDWKAGADLADVVLEIGALQEPLKFLSGSVTLGNAALKSEFEAELGSALRARGTLLVPDVENAKPVFTLATALFDLDKVLAKTATGSPSSPSSAGKSELLATGKITADKFRFAPLEASSARADARVFSDRLELGGISMALYGGAAAGSLRLDTRSTPSRLSLNADARNVDVERLLAAFPDAKGSITGTAELALQADMSLGKDPLNSATGTGSFAIRDGKLPRFHLGSLETLGKIQQVLSGGAAGGSGGTTFTIINGDLNIGGGRVASNRIHMDSNRGTVDLRGSFGFDQTLAYDGQANLTAGGSDISSPGSILGGILGKVTKQQVAGLSIPFAISGTFSNPRVTPGRGLPSFRTSQPSQQQQQQPQQKKSILDIFRKPP
jgi:AsmA protein